MIDEPGPNELDPRWLSTPDLDPERLERIRRRGRRLLEAPASGAAVRAEAVLVASFSVLTLVWAVSAIVPA